MAPILWNWPMYEIDVRLGCQNWTIEQWTKVNWFDESLFLLDQVDAWGCVHCFMLWEMFCWETLDPSMYVDVPQP